MMTPYYEQDGITIYHGDCRQIITTLFATVLITDPPYGVNLGSSDQRGGTHGLAKGAYSSYADTYEEWCELVPPSIANSLEVTSGRGAVFTGPHVTDLPRPKVVGGIYVPAALGRNEWGFTSLITVFFYGVNQRLNKGSYPTVLRSVESAESNGHPCPKPIGWMRWLVGLTTAPDDVVFDPFMGSGTTLVAAKQMGRKAIGIEREEKYCEIAAKRLAQGALPMEFSA
jgi:DNA modification methylase